MERYSEITKKIKREIVLLKGSPCKWGRCTFCDYIEDNSTDIDSNIAINKEILSKVTGKYGVLEVINSGNIFELPEETLMLIKEIIEEKAIHTLFFEAHWIYRKRIKKMKEFFGIRVIVKTGLETFDHDFRENVLKKGFDYKNIEELKQYFDSVCLMVGIWGQSPIVVREDIRLAKEHFDHFTVNVYVNNSTEIKADEELIKWFQEEYRWLDDDESCDVLWVNTDFGVGD